MAATLFFPLLSARYEQESFLLTSNQRVAARDGVCGDPVIATAVLDRLRLSAYLVNICGYSDRLKDKKRAGVGEFAGHSCTPGDSLGGPKFDRR
jgi:DNA replication protein DnaC